MEIYRALRECPSINRKFPDEAFNPPIVGKRSVSAFSHLFALLGLG
jgi:hypothetical protein